MDGSTDSCKFDMIIFDMDGVITTERQYWICAALTVYEMYSKDELNVKWCEEHALEICNQIFSNDETIKLIKSLGVNTNWDLAYLTYLATLIGSSNGCYDEEIWNFVWNYYSDNDINAPYIYDYVANAVADLYNYDYDYVKREGTLFKEIQDKFQQWYMGDEVYERVYNKKASSDKVKNGLIFEETPMFEANEIHKLLKSLKEKNILLGVGTGRTFFEIMEPLKHSRLNEYFPLENFITYDDVNNAQEELKSNGFRASLAKPNPFVFLKSALGKDFSNIKIYNNEYNKNILNNILVVGDAGADILAAKSCGMKFAAVLTGVAGKDSYDYFKELDADYILNSVLELNEIL